jgi:hypothetical protein
MRLCVELHFFCSFACLFSCFFLSFCRNVSCVVRRLSGTGVAGATIRLYIEQYSDDPSTFATDAQVALGPITKTALDLSNLTALTGRTEPTVIT